MNYHRITIQHRDYTGSHRFANIAFIKGVGFTNDPVQVDYARQMSWQIEELNEKESKEYLDSLHKLQDMRSSSSSAAQEIAKAKKADPKFAAK